MTSTLHDKTEMSSFLSGKFHHVDVDRIEKELLELWLQAENASESDEPAVTRACSITFILFTADANAEVDAGFLLEDITLKHPCRAILAMAIPAEQEHLEAWVTARCRMIPGKSAKQICCEQITVRWEGPGTRNLASVVSPLQLVDLPTWLWCQHKRPSKELLGPFFPFMERLVVDTAEFDDRLTYMFDLKDAYLRLKDGGALYDLNWRRLLPWRQTIAHAFEETNGLLELEDLDLVSSIVIGVSERTDAPPRGQSAQGLLLASWLASRLGWTFDSAKRNEDNDVDLKFKWSRKKINVSLKAVPLDTVAPGTVCFFAADFVGKEKSLVVMQKEGCPGLVAALMKRSEVHETLCMAEKTQSQLVVDVLDSPLTAELYKELLDIVCELCGALK
ncbi:MAG: glucose-6-phosphate dehydrogenase assembly protein OpcA [Candidatus Melainabacteria bacterium]|nr:glucose-6-phosphate dehydrogenase assembly protein OpcA [Candidatus Melainabacteria bacterium]